MMVAGIASIMHVTFADAQGLLNGFVGMSVANALGVDAHHIQSWIDTGVPAPIFADRLRMETETAEDIGMRLGKKGRIGIIVGMLLDR